MRIKQSSTAVIDNDSLLDMYVKIKNRFKRTSFLESLGNTNLDTSRYTIIGVIAKKQLVMYTDRCLMTDFSDGSKKEVDFLEVIDQFVNVHTIPGVESSPIQLGSIGYMGYELKHYFEKLDKSLKKDFKGPDGCLVKYSVLYVVDKIEEKAYWVFEDSIGDEYIEELEKLVDKETEFKVEKFNVLGDVHADFTKEEYLDMIRKTREYIAAGDIFQANITCRFHGKYVGDPFALYVHLRKTTPNPFFAYLDYEEPIISTSPERFFKIQDDKIFSYPIKGTIECEIDGVDQKDTLLNSEKDYAENVIITDLIRNDIGYVCKQGSVKVDALCAVKRFNHIYHLESIIEGELKDDVGMGDVLRANFPGGSITGAPKIRCMDIIEELENTQRGPYTGAIGFWGENGYVDTSIGIRIVYFDSDSFYLHAGGGITYASDPESEYEELMTKAVSLVNALREFNILKEHREKIDRLDRVFLQTLNDRLEVVKEVGRIKRKYGISVMQDGRVKEMLEKRKKMCTEFENIPEEFVEEIFTNIVEVAMAMER